jgi:hypothetical protein
MGGYRVPLSGPPRMQYDERVMTASLTTIILFVNRFSGF